MSSDQAMGSREPLSQRVQYSTVTAEQYDTLVEIREKAQSLTTFSPDVDGYIGSLDHVMGEIETLAKTSHELPTNKGLLTHGVSLETFKLILETNLLASRAEVFKQTGKADYNMADIKAEENEDGTYTVTESTKREPYIVETEEELNEITGRDNKRWKDEYYQLCFTTNSTYHKMGGKGIFFAFSRSSMLTEFQSVDDDGLHLFDPKYNSENKAPFAIDLAKEPYLILVSKEEAHELTLAIIDMPDHLFDTYGGKSAWMLAHLSVHDSINAEMADIQEKFFQKHEQKPGEKGVFMPSGAVEEKVMIRNNAPLIKYVTEKSPTVNLEKKRLKKQQ